MTSDLRTPTLSRATLSPRVRALLDAAPALGPEHHWEGALTGAYGASAAWTGRVTAVIGFHGGVIAGSGRGVDFKGLLAGGEAFDLTGGLHGAALDLQFWFSVHDMNGQPFAATGVLSEDRREMTGEWSFACFSPRECGCEGGGGTFRLARVSPHGVA